MFHRIKSVRPVNDFQLIIQFMEGVTKNYDIKPLFDKWPVFRTLKENPNIFKEVRVDVGGNGIVWNDNIDLSSIELFKNGKVIHTEFDGLLSLGNAAILWKLDESTLRKAIGSGKFKKDIDVQKFGKQWIITYEAMERVYGKLD